MAFRLTQSKTYTWPVSVDVLTEDGKPVTHELTAVFRRMSQGEVDHLAHQAREGAISDDKLLDEVLVRLEGIEDAAGCPLTPSQELTEQVLSIVPVRPRCVMAWFESLSGAPRKN